ncbi:MAG: SymE family type I addiction module toxin [Candidatus Thiodiazotropha sp. L084R]
MEKKTRNLKVVRSFCTKPKALLPLSGCWLERAGFKIGTRVDVIVREECLVILPSESEGNKI